jgi:hypothetical protein
MAVSRDECMDGRDVSFRYRREIYNFMLAQNFSGGNFINNTYKVGSDAALRAASIHRHIGARQVYGTLQTYSDPSAVCLNTPRRHGTLTPKSSSGRLRILPITIPRHITASPRS